jgi:hypothetical protein
MERKELWFDRLRWIIITAIVVLLAEHYVAPILHWDTKKHILNELQHGRDKLQIASASFELGWHRTTNIKFNYENKVPKAINYEYAEKVLKMYQALNNGISEAVKLDQELEKAEQGKIASMKGAIVRSLDVVDQLGPDVAKYLGGTWRIISKDLPPQEIINQLEIVVKISGSSSETSVTTRGVMYDGKDYKGIHK